MKIIINTSQISKKAFHLIEKSQEKKISHKKFEHAHQLALDSWSTVILDVNPHIKYFACLPSQLNHTQLLKSIKNSNRYVCVVLNCVHCTPKQWATTWRKRHCVCGKKVIKNEISSHFFQATFLDCKNVDIIPN